MSKTMKLITAQWDLMLEYAIENANFAFEIYKKNKNNKRHKNGRRKTVSPCEYGRASISIVLSVTALEGIANAYALYRRAKKFDQWDPVEKKLSLCIPTGFNPNVCQAVKELAILRNAIIHGHVWKKTRHYTSDDKLKSVRSYATKPFKTYFQSEKLKQCIDLKNRTTKQFSFSIIPTDVNFLDSLMGLAAAKKVFELLNCGIIRREQIIAFSKSLEEKYDYSVFDNLMTGILL